MELTEKMIERILQDCIDDWHGVFNEPHSVQPDLDAVVIDYAHAIHERLKEGVLYEAILPRSYDDISETVNYGLGQKRMNREDVWPHIEVFGAAQARFVGVERVQVTVKKT